MIRDEQFWAEAPIYALHYDVHGMFALAEAALRHDGTDLYRYVSPKSGASLKKFVVGYLRMAFPLERKGAEGAMIRLATFGDGSTGGLISGRLDGHPEPSCPPLLVRRIAKAATYAAVH
jgi:hypothetical protein